MNPYTVIYTECWTHGCHQNTSVKLKHIQAKDVLDAYSQLEGAAVFVFPGHLTPLGCE